MLTKEKVQIRLNTLETQGICLEIYKNGREYRVYDRKNGKDLMISGTLREIHMWACGFLCGLEKDSYAEYRAQLGKCVNFAQFK